MTVKRATTRATTIVMSAVVSAASLGLVAGDAAAQNDSKAEDDSKARCIDEHVRHQELERSRNLRGARDAALACAQPTCPAMVQEECVEGLRRLEAALPSIVVKVVDWTGDDVAGARVLVDGELRGPVGTAIFVDPGPRRLRIESDGEILERDVVVVEGEQGRIVEVRLAKPEQESTSRLVGDSEAPAPEEGPGRAIAISGLVIGMAGLVTFGVAGGVALARRDELASGCDDGVCPPERAADLADGRLAGHIATAGMVVAGAGAVLGAVGLVLAMSADEETPRAIVGPGFLGVGGAF